MSDSLTTRLDRPYGQQLETRAAAVRVMQPYADDDDADVLGEGPHGPPFMVTEYGLEEAGLL